MCNRWTEQQKATVLAMHEKGATSAQIGAAVGHSPSSVRNIIRKHGLAQSRADWRAQFGIGDALETCPEQRRLTRNAIIGSAMLRDAILRCAA